MPGITAYLQHWKLSDCVHQHTLLLLSSWLQPVKWTLGINCKWPLTSWSSCFCVLCRFYNSYNCVFFCFLDRFVFAFLDFHLLKMIGIFSFSCISLKRIVQFFNWAEGDAIKLMSGKVLIYMMIVNFFVSIIWTEQ